MNVALTEDEIVSIRHRLVMYRCLFFCVNYSNIVPKDSASCCEQTLLP